MGASQWMEELRAVTEKRDRERSLERETEERARTFLGIAENYLAQPSNQRVVSEQDTQEALTGAAREGLDEAKARYFIDATAKGLDEGVLNIVEGKSGSFEQSAETLAKQVQSLKLPADRFIAVLNVVAPVIVGLVSRRLQDSQKLPSSTAEAVVHVAIQSLRAALSKPEYLKADAYLKAQKEAERPI